MFQHADQSPIQFPVLTPENTLYTEVSPDQVLSAVAEYFKIKRQSLKSRRNSESLRIPRQIAMYLCLQSTALSYRAIGAFFAGRHGSTIRRHCLEIQTALQENTFTQAIITDISRKIFR